MTDVDLQGHPVDERARRAGAQLRRAASLRAIPDVPASSAVHDIGRIVALSLATVLVLVVGLVVIANRRSDTVPAGPDADLHWIVGDLPEGWAPTGVSGPGSAVWNTVNATITVFGTAAAPDGPLLMASAYPEAPWGRPAEAASGATEFQELLVDGVEVVLAVGPSGERLSWSKPGDRWISFRSTGLTDDELVDVASHSSVGADFGVSIDAAHLPGGMSPLGSGELPELAPSWWTSVTGQGAGPETVAVVYTTTSGPMTLAVSRSVAPQLAFLALQGDLQKVRIGDVAGWRSTAVPGWVAWVRDERLFFLAAFTEDLDLAAIAEKIRPATPAEWASVSMAGTVAAPADTVQPDGSALVTETTPEESSEASTVTDPPRAVSDVVDDSVRDVPLAWRGLETDNHQATLTAVSASDEVLSTNRFTMVGGAVQIAFGDSVGGGAVIFEPTFVDGTSMGWQSDVAWVITTQPTAAAFRVLLADGTRRVIKLARMTDDQRTGIAVLDAPLSMVVSCDLVDADGVVLAELTEPRS